MIDSLLNRRKAIGEIVAASIMILIVSIIGVTLYNESFNTYNTAQLEYQDVIQTQKELIEEKFNIPYVYQKDSTLMIAIHNYGIHDILIDFVYVDGTQYSVMEEVKSETVEWINVPYPGSGQHQIRVLTERTSFMEVIYTD